jgi:hypothetical protein
MAGDRAGAAGEYTGHQLALPRQHRVAHGEHSLVHPVEPPHPHPPGEGTRPHSRRLKLRTGDHAVLTLSQAGNLMIDGVLGRFSIHAIEKLHRTRFSPRRGRSAAGARAFHRIAAASS